ncbi:helix-turn-helix transcriptional regulator [Clostridiaceae bacterium NSJ-31]|uniref:Helix-turn-helix transcriptional regulator n=1 Tax=Ligaoa zhengdingensis TaxID=2763658 RepID=A0A926DYK0_9FIRM|nr:helix-turn-helix transcriptional regulator [Ligaoa zhengdingensis]MBC8547615.1 helix-turn-helix transcriptional regulator [Ligaoa zhengdingensis]
MDIEETNRRQIQQMCENLRLLSEARGWTFGELERRTGIPKKILVRAEQRGNIGADVLLTLSEFYQIKPHLLFFPLTQE